MNYPESHNVIRNQILEHDSNSQCYQNTKNSNMPKRPPKSHQDNDKSGPPNNSIQKSDVQSSLNYNCAPFTPKQQPQHTIDSTHMLSEVGADSVNLTHKLACEHDGNLFHTNPNIGYKPTYGGNITNACMYNALGNLADFMPYVYQYPNSGTASNYWSMLPSNNYYGLSNLGLSAGIEPNKSMFMVGKNSDNSFSTSSNFNSANVYSKPHHLMHNNRQNQQFMKQNSSNTINPEAPAPGLMWSDTPLEKTLGQFTDLHLSYQDYNNIAVVNNDRAKHQSFDPITINEILDSVSDQLSRKRLSEAMQYINPPHLTLKSLSRARFFVIKSYSEDDLHRAIKYGVWCSTKIGNKKLNDAYIDQLSIKSPNQDVGRVFLFFSVNGSGFFAGIAEMISHVDFDEQCGFWSQNKWVGRLNIKWHYVKDVRNSSLRHIRSEANENKPVTNSRDAVEVTPLVNGIEFIKVFHHSKHETSVFDDFEHYEQREMNPGVQ